MIKLVKKTDAYLDEYLAFLRSKPFIQLKSADYYLKQFSYFKGIMELMPCTVYLLEYQTQKYLYVSEECKNIIGYSSQEIMDKGHAWILSILHPEDQQLFCNKVFLNFVNYMRSLPLNKIRSARFSLNYRGKRKDGVYIQVLDRHVVLEADSSGNPLLVLGVVSDISGSHALDKMFFSIANEDKNGNWEVISSRSFPETDLIISKREKEILSLLHKGYSSKQIADNLFISIHTVNAHRRNLLEKTKCHNTAELLSIALVRGVR